MRPIVIGAGRGSRLGPETDEVPKALVPVMGRPMLEWILDALGAAGFARKDVVFICGYKADVVRARYPELTFVENRDWERNNILASLLCAREHLGGGFVSTYADIVYRGSTVKKLRRLAARQGARLRHRLAPALRRPQSAPRDRRARRCAPRAIASSSCRGASRRSGERRVHRRHQVHADGAREMVEAFDEARGRVPPGTTWREGRTFERAYLIDLFQEMIERGSAFHRVDTHGGYMEDRHARRPRVRREVVARVRARVSA